MNYLQLAKEGKNKWYLYLLTILIILISGIFFSIPVGIAGLLYGINDNLMPNVSKNSLLILNLLPFIGIFISMLISIKFIHNRSIKSIFTINLKFNYKKMFKAICLWLILLVICEIISFLITDYEYIFTFNSEKFIPLLLISIILIPIQATAEELLFRGYLMQAFGLLSKNKFIPLILAGILFGLLHSSNPEVKEHGLAFTLPSYIYMGLFLGFLVIIENGLETAIGVHIINNIYACVFVTFPSSALQTDALFTSEEINPLLSFIFIIIFSVIFIAVFYRNKMNKIFENFKV